MGNVEPRDDQGVFSDDPGGRFNSAYASRTNRHACRKTYRKCPRFDDRRTKAFGQLD